MGALRTCITLASRSRPMRIATMVLAFAVAGGTAAAQTQQRADAHAGTLTCTMQATASQASTEAEVSCNFAAVVGAGGTFEGVIARDPQSSIPQGKRVIVWSVLAPTMEIELKALSGKYVGTTGGGGVTRLVNQDTNIVLQPETSSAQLGAEIAITVLTLRFDPIRA